MVEKLRGIIDQKGRTGHPRCRVAPEPLGFRGKDDPHVGFRGLTKDDHKSASVVNGGAGTCVEWNVANSPSPDRFVVIVNLLAGTRHQSKKRNRRRVVRHDKPSAIVQIHLIKDRPSCRPKTSTIIPPSRISTNIPGAWAKTSVLTAPSSPHRTLVSAIPATCAFAYLAPVSTSLNHRSPAALLLLLRGRSSSSQSSPRLPPKPTLTPKRELEPDESVNRREKSNWRNKPRTSVTMRMMTKSRLVG